MASKDEEVKWIPGTNFLVDGFLFQCDRCKHYFLTHCHSDHTIGLAKSFNKGIIYCTEISAQLLIKDKGVKPQFVCALELNKTVEIEGVQVTFMDANHCPGACIILFEISTGENVRRILHTGDFRFQAYMADYGPLKGKQIDILYLDTTYAWPKHTFPPQEDAIRNMADIMIRELQHNPRTKFVVNSYRIGKERAYLGAAKIAGLQVWAPPEKRKLLDLLGLSEADRKVLTNDPNVAEIHVGNIAFNSSNLKKSGYQVIGFRATGWEFRKQNQYQARWIKGTKVYGIPYSEHSSWNELRLCVQLLKPKKIISTVYSKDPEKIINQFADLMAYKENLEKNDVYLKRCNVQNTRTLYDYKFVKNKCEKGIENQDRIIKQNQLNNQIKRTEAGQKLVAKSSEKQSENIYLNSQYQIENQMQITYYQDINGLENQNQNNYQREDEKNQVDNQFPLINKRRKGIEFDNYLYLENNNSEEIINQYTKKQFQNISQQQQQLQQSTEARQQANQLNNQFKIIQNSFQSKNQPENQHIQNSSSLVNQPQNINQFRNCQLRQNQLENIFKKQSSSITELREAQVQNYEQYVESQAVIDLTFEDDSSCENIQTEKGIGSFQRSPSLRQNGRRFKSGSRSWRRSIAGKKLKTNSSENKKQQGKQCLLGQTSILDFVKPLK